MSESLVAKQKTFSKALNAKVVIQQQQAGNGKIVIRFNDPEKRDRLLQLMERML